MRTVKLGIVLLSLMVSQVSPSGIFKLEFIQFNNDNGLLYNHSCCSGILTDDICTEQCNTYFRVCFKHFQRTIDKGYCTYGEYTSNVIGNNSFRFPKDVKSFMNPLDFPISFAWKGDFSLIIEAYHQDNSLITNFNGSSNILPSNGWKSQQWNDTTVNPKRSIQFRYKIDCDDTFYGPQCSTLCIPRNDELGHYECDSNGEKICRQGWQGEYCDKAICLEGCHPQHGYCDNPNECSCKIGWQGRLCDECVTYPGCEHGYCEKSFECTCYEGWGGLYCNQDLNFCTNHKPCKNGGTCTNTGEGSYTCTCPIGYTGTNCEVEVDNCQIQPCKNGGVCKDIGNDFMCDCPNGFSGARCEIAAMHCEENPCANGGTCQTVGSTYRCLCAPGWGGVNCAQQKDECSSNPCQNGGSCVDELNGFTCVCLPGFSGSFCEVNRDECAGRNPCQNGGACVDGDNSFQCRCRPGFIGAVCEINVDDCVTRPCANGGRCVDKVNDFECFCADGYTGRMCNEEINECASNPCSYGGSCEDLINGYKCHCPSDREGDRCQYKLGEAPSTTKRRPPTTTTSLPTTKKTEKTPYSAVGVGKITSNQEKQEGGSVQLTQTELILVFCLGIGIPLCLLFVLAAILLYRRFRKQGSGADSEESHQNQMNSMNNRINNDVGKAKCADYEYAAEKTINDMEAAAHQFQLDYRNQAASTLPSKVIQKDLIKNINPVMERQMQKNSKSSCNGNAVNGQLLTTADHLRQYCQQMQQNGCSPYDTLSSNGSTLPAATVSASSTYNRNNNKNSSNISTIYGTLTQAQSVTGSPSSQHSQYVRHEQKQLPPSPISSPVEGDDTTRGFLSERPLSYKNNIHSVGVHHVPDMTSSTSRQDDVYFTNIHCSATTV